MRIFLLIGIGIIIGIVSILSLPSALGHNEDSVLTRLAKLEKNQMLPVGSVVASLLNKAQFQAIYGKGWILADGSSVSESQYHIITGKLKIPDLRGVFIRGKNNGRNDGKQNPNDLELGAYQTDQFQSHVHEYNRGGSGGNLLYSLAGGTNTGTGRGQTNFIVSGKHGVETRPRNVTVNFFIRIN